MRNIKFASLLIVLFLWLASFSIIFSFSCSCFFEEDEDDTSWWETIEDISEAIDPTGECFYTDSKNMDYDWTCNLDKMCCFEIYGTVGQLKYKSSCAENCDKCNAKCSYPIEEEEGDDDYYDDYYN